MRCLTCSHPVNKVIESRPSPNGRRRRHLCSACGTKFTSYNNRVAVPDGKSTTVVALALLNAEREKGTP